MKTFVCQSCGQPVFFENTRCTRCGAVLGFLPDQMRLSALVDAGDGIWTAAPSSPPTRARPPGFFGRLLRTRAPASEPGPGATRHYRKCLNYAEHDVCNWMVPADDRSLLCIACAPNRTVPNLGRPGNLEKWARIERGKRRLAYGLLRLGLTVETRQQNPEQGLAFDFLSSEDAPPDQPVMTGHASGLITVNIDEADPSLRERTRLDMDEQYRTLIGHFRHEIGHYFWDTLILDGGRLEGFRALFGNEQTDYGEALQRYYDAGPPADWQDRFITPYASAHPWEDWAETWAHYMHIVDTLETAGHFGIEVEWPLPDGSRAVSDPDFDPYDLKDFQPMIEHWLPLTFAINSLNRSMGQQDLYPFVLPQPAIDKMAYVHRTIRAAAKRS
ncbi:zinc-binding metallopeptidase family protein [Thiocapsa marina]|uniref:Zinc-ribbon domain-containing protein n=1 Tax=Thiocapsa marina 5811 TaxID=768671 RepID=F9U5K7_9GAMM|nr:putative zinc-binding peptidase [Thiocapsa marina]EGV20430.1 protein of unknown function UCP012641 [Thiocapsa marina 5811]